LKDVGHFGVAEKETTARERGLSADVGLEALVGRGG
jgi:hypothetical protein